MSFVKVMPKYLIPYDAIVNGIVFLISFSDCSLQMYRSIVYFCLPNFYNFAELIY